MSGTGAGGGSGEVVVALPSLWLGDTAWAHGRAAALEHRFLAEILALAVHPGRELVLLCSVAPTPVQLDDVLSLLPAGSRGGVRERLHVVALDDPGGRRLATKLLDRPQVLDAVRGIVAGRAGVVEPWDVTADEMAVAAALGLPLAGTDVALRGLGSKSGSRRLFREAGIDVAPGEEDLHSPEDVLAALARLAATGPAGHRAVVKLDEGAAGEGNRVVLLGDVVAMRSAVEGLPSWFRSSLAEGCVVEELVTGEDRSSPSVQLDLGPDGAVTVVSTHDQLLGGVDGQTFEGARFPASAQDAAAVAAIGRRVGVALVRAGARGRVGVDLVATTGADGTRRHVALEVNLRKGHTWHPVVALSALVPGRYDETAGRWRADSGGDRHTVATDLLSHPAWVGREPQDAVEAVRRAGLRFDPDRGTGVALHLLSCLRLDGRVGVHAIGRSRVEAGELFLGAVGALEGQV